MNDDLDSIEEPSADEIAALGPMLARADVWDDPPTSLEDAVVGAIAEETTIAPAVALDERRSSVGATWWLAAAAAVLVVVAGVALITRGGDSITGVQIALAGTEAAPDASADVTLAATPAGLKILLDAEGLEPAPDGYFYEAWVSNGSIRVSAGSFHVRDGHGPIELWAGVVDPDFTTLAVTLEPIDGQTDSSGDVRLRGRYDLGGG
jgi:hypothetical protein